MVTLTRNQAILVDIAVWTIVGVVVGYAMHRRPAESFSRDGFVTRLRGFERDGRVYEAIGIRRWKDRLPELGALFRGGVSKRTTGGPELYDRFTAETRRGELTHWWVLAAAPFFALWNPWYLTVVMWVYALVANVPCILVQRYNRVRLARIAARRSSRSR